jgi:hypothetical protein
MPNESAYKVCYYCDRLFYSKYGVGDHFPLPRRHGGISCVACCSDCHKLKDNVTLINWPPDLLWQAVNQIAAYGNANKDFAPAYGVIARAAVANKEDDFGPYTYKELKWNETAVRSLVRCAPHLQTQGRLLLAKQIAIYSDIVCSWFPSSVL